MTYKKDLLMPSVDGRDEMYERMKDVRCMNSTLCYVICDFVDS